MDARMEEAKAFIWDRAATAKCPYCAGSGRRVTPLATNTLTADAIAEVRCLKTTKNATRINRVVAMIEQLGSLK